MVLRHFVAAAFGVLLAPIIWGLTAWSTYRFGSVTVSAGALSDLDKPGTDFILPVLLLAVAGAFIGLLLGTPVSPLAPASAGALLVVAGIAFLAVPASALDILQRLPGKHDLVFAVPAASGVALLLGVALLAPLFSPGRWRAGGAAAAPSSDNGRAPGSRHVQRLRGAGTARMSRRARLTHRVAHLGGPHGPAAGHA